MSNVTRLENELFDASRRYHNGLPPSMTDEEFDAKKKHLLKISPDSPVGKMVGHAPIDGNTVKHANRMLSLDYFTSDDPLPTAIAEMDKTRDLDIEFKFDGIAGALTYDMGKLLYAATRGDGMVGELLTDNALQANGVPLDIPDKDPHTYAGEFILPIKAFEALEEGYVNPRNGLAGLMRRHDASTLTGKGIVFVCYKVDSFLAKDGRAASYRAAAKQGIGTLESLFPDAFAKLEKLNQGYHSHTLTLRDVHDEVLKFRKDLPFEIDGLVLKARTDGLINKYGEGSLYPRWAAAFKFPPQSASTKVKHIAFQVSRSGLLTPVAKVEPVFVGGVTYTSVTLHNLDEMERLGINVGDTVMIQRRGDVIPKVTEVVESVTGKKAKPVLPVVCPACKGPVIRDKGEINLRCMSPNSCQGQLSASIEHYASRDALDIDGLGEVVAKELSEMRKVMKMTDIYNLTLEDLKTLEGFADVSAQNLLDGITKSKESSFDRVIYGLGIRAVGKSTSKVVARLVGSFENWVALHKAKEFDTVLEQASKSEIKVDARKALSAVMHTNEGQELIRSLIHHGVGKPAVSKTVSDKLKGQTWVITGSFEDVSRDDIRELLESHGAKVGSSVSKKTNGLVAGANAGSKLSKAKALGVEVVDLVDVQKRLSDG